MPRNIKLTIEYDGTLFNGWQAQQARSRQKRRFAGRSLRTVQGEIETVLKKIFKKSPKLIGAGRTDSGVHALGQVANFKTTSSMPLTEIQNALNANLPEDIAIVKVEETPASFHAQYSAKSKVYRYTILNRPARCALQRNYVLYYPYQLNITVMRREARTLVGRKNFKSFAASDPARIKTKTIRMVKRLTIKRRGDILTIDIEADGFLYKMVRNIVGTLLEVGRGRLAIGSVKKILAQKDRKAAGTTAKPKGLMLLEVRY